jgi:hypothetical protein
MSLISTPSCSHTLDNFKRLSLDILSIYAQLEILEEINSEHNIKHNIEQKSLKYYTSSESISSEFSDNVLTNFDKLSNEFNIGVVSRLNPIQASVVLLIFRALYDNCYWIFDSNTGAFLFKDLELSKSDLSNLYEKYDAHLWWIVLEKYILETFEDDEADEADEADEDKIAEIAKTNNIYGSTYINLRLPSKDDNQYMEIKEIIKHFAKI